MLQLEDERRNVEQYKNQVMLISDAFSFVLRNIFSQRDSMLILYLFFSFFASEMNPFSSGWQDEQPDASNETSTRGVGGGVDKGQCQVQEAAEGAGWC